MAISAKASVAAQNGSAGSFFLFFFFFVMNYIVKNGSLHTWGEARKVCSISAEM